MIVALLLVCVTAGPPRVHVATRPVTTVSVPARPALARLLPGYSSDDATLIRVPS